MANLQTQTLIFLKTLYQILKVSRPLHWIKNLSLFAALIFSGGLFSKDLFIKIFLAFISFNLASSATYIFNDIKDAPLDRLHPTKKNRPIASGKLKIFPALVSLIFFIICSLVTATYLNNNPFLVSVLLYLLIQGLYSLALKDIAVVDILIIASGFVLRVYAGAFVIDAHLSVWFLLCVISVALFLAAGKRRAELGFIPEGITRKSLSKYKRELLNSYVTMFGNAAWMSWALFAFFESPQPSLSIWLTLAEISKTTTISKLLMITLPIVIFGIMRYEALIFEDRAESPERLLLTDKFLISSIFIWIFLVILTLYGGIASY